MYICSPVTQISYCPGGEIGRRTVFRSQRSQGCAGSNPVLGTKMEKGAVSESEPSLSHFPCSRSYSSTIHAAIFY